MIAIGQCEESLTFVNGVFKKLRRAFGMRGLNPVYAGAVAILVIGLILTTINIHRLSVLQQEFIDLTHPGDTKSCDAKPSLRFTPYGKNLDSGYLKHVYNVLDRLGYERVSYNLSSDWDLMWAHDYPFKKLKTVLKAMKKGQKVNKLPGSGYVTNKVNLATSGLDHIPPAFKIPNDTEKLKQYAHDNPDKMFVQKNSNHRGIKIENFEDLDLGKTGSFIQEFIHDPFLVDGYKFDIGVYTMITSVDPLRIYVYNGDCLIRFCPKKYHPFDQTDRDKYVVHDDYKPTWEVPTLSKLYSDLKYTFKETLNAHIRSVKGQEALDEMWSTIHEIIIKVYKNKEEDFVKAAKKYPHKRAFFEMVRFDFVLDSKLNVYLMEVNMSPNLSTKHFSGNRLLYEQVIYNFLRLVGIGRPGLKSSSLLPTTKEEFEMQVSDKDISVFVDDCASEKCSQPEACDQIKCKLCQHCLSSDHDEFLKMAFLEHVNRHVTKRLYPRSIGTKKEAINPKKEEPELSDNNAIMHQWFRGKCIMDESWCH